MPGACKEVHCRAFKRLRRRGLVGPSRPHAQIPCSLGAASKIPRLHCSAKHQPVAGTLQVLNLSNNNFEFLPADVGWLPLKELHVSGNPQLRVPQAVLKHGFK